MSSSPEINLSLYNPETDGVLVLGERYKLTEFLDQGGMGRLYLAKDSVLNRTVVVKILLPQYLDNEKFIKRFQREAQTLSKINHPHLLTVYDYGVYQVNYPYIVTEYIRGISLSQLIEERGRIPLDETVEILGQVCDGLHSAHQQGIIHRDMKPDNILVIREAQQEWVKVIDFGLAVEGPEGQSSLTETGSFIGTAAYMAPEQFERAEVGPRIDVYAIGVILYEMLTGIRPFIAETIPQYCLRHTSAPVPKLAKCVPPIEGLIPEIQGILEKALAKKPKDRYENTVDLKRELRLAVGAHVSEEALPIPAAARAAARPNFVTCESVPHKAGDWVQDFLKKTRHHKQRLKLLVLALLVALVTAVAMAMFDRFMYRNIPGAEITSLFTQSNVPSSDFNGMPALRVGIRGTANNYEDSRLKMEIRVVDLKGRALPILAPEDSQKFQKWSQFEKEKGNFGYTFDLHPDNKSFSIFKTLELPYFLFTPPTDKHPFTFVISARLLTSERESLAIKDSEFIESPPNIHSSGQKKPLTKAGQAP